MTKSEKERYEGPEQLKEILKRVLNGKRYLLECGHHVSFFHHLGNDVTIQNGKNIKVICSLCGH